MQPYVENATLYFISNAVEIHEPYNKEKVLQPIFSSEADAPYVYETTITESKHGCKAYYRQPH